MHAGAMNKRIVEFRVEFWVLNFQSALEQAFVTNLNVEFRVEFRPWVLNFGPGRDQVAR